MKVEEAMTDDKPRGPAADEPQPAKVIPFPRPRNPLPPKGEPPLPPSAA